MNKTKKSVRNIYLVGMMALFSFNSFASVDCNFVPKVAKTGAYGGNEKLLFVCDGFYQCYDLGPGADVQAKNRYDTVMTALNSGKSVKLRFYNHFDCTTARVDRAVPNSTWIIR